MTDQIFYEELRATIRDAIASYLDTCTGEELRELATESLNLPPRPTLSDMTYEERRECQWMRCDVKGEDGSATIYAPNWKNGSATILWPSGFIEQIDWEHVTPRPDLPRLAWPGDPD